MVLSAGKRIAVTEEDKEAQKQRIIRAAIRVFGRYGYHKSTVSQVARQADMGRGTLYWYYKSKEDIFRSIVQQFMSEATEKINRQLQTNISFESKIKGFIRDWLELATREEDIARIMYSVFSQSHGKFAQEMLKSVKKMYLDIIEILKNCFAREILKGQMRPADTRRLARLLIGLLDGIILQHIFVEKISPEPMTEVLTKLVLQGLIR